jgi:hypothetical protein
MKNNAENSQPKANSSSLLPENILHEKWNKRNSEEMELFEELIDHCKKKKFKTVLTILEENYVHSSKQSKDLRPLSEPPRVEK